jgi:hypothetical protein
MDDYFKNIEDVKRFLNFGGDIVKQSIVKNYMELIEKDVDQIDVNELNGFIKYEEQSFYDGYERHIG